MIVHRESQGGDPPNLRPEVLVFNEVVATRRKIRQKVVNSAVLGSILVQSCPSQGRGLRRPPIHSLACIPVSLSFFGADQF
jgi:hypothetical protein